MTPTVSAAFNINTFIKLLRNAHRLLSSEIQSLRRFLLQCTRSKRKRSFSEPLARFISETLNSAFSIFLTISFNSCSDLIVIFSDLFRKTCCKRALFPFYLQNHVKCPILFRINALISSSLSATRRSATDCTRPALSPRLLLPKEAADPVSDHTIQNAACLLRIN